MESDFCPHKDVREIDNLKCCMSCGETLFIWTQPGTSSQLKDSLPSKEDDASHGLSHTYRDLRLSTGHAIRIVLLLPGDFHDPIFCMIAIVDLDKAQYAAVSYTWATEDGDAMKTGRIHLPDGIIPVTENCEATLRQLRLPSAPRPLWIDAICINQSNVQERNHQVGLMDQIYRSASTVHVCINDPDRRYTECVRGLNSGAGLTFWLKNDYTSTPIKQLNELFQRRYFSRVWVIQELYLAREIVLHVNSDEVPRLGHVLKDLHKILDVPRLLQSIQGEPRRLRIMECLKMSLSASSSDPRDKVFAILSLLDPQFRQYVPVDYALGYNQILGLAVMLSISESRNLILLRFVRLPVTSDSATACSFGLHEFLDFLQYGHLGNDWLLDTNKPKIVGVKMVSKETQQVEYVNRSVSVVTDGSFSMIEQTSQWFPAQHILPRMKVYAKMIDISLGPLQNGGVSFWNLVTRQADGEFAEYAWLQNIFKRPSSGVLSESEQHRLSSRSDWGDLFMCKSGMENFDRWSREYVSRQTSKRKDISDTVMSSAQHDSESLLFRTHYSVGSTFTPHIEGDHVFAIVGAAENFLLRPIAPSTYRIVGTCYLWAADKLDYWNPGTYKGLWPEKPVDLGAQYRTIEIY